MAEEREPPPLFDDEVKAEEEPESEDLFSSVLEEVPKPSVETKEDSDDREDLFADAETEVELGSPVETRNGRMFDSGDAATHEVSALRLDAEPVAPSVQRDDTVHIYESVSEEEDRDQFSMEITVTDPKKMGDGMNAYIAYRVNTKTTAPQFHSRELSVYRRFSDFLGLHDKLVEKHQHNGVIIPPAPEKSVLGMTKIKMSKEEAGSADFVEKRRAALERFVMRASRQRVLQTEPAFVDFLQMDGELPRSSGTSALSGAGVLRLFNKVGDSIGKITYKMDETDQVYHLIRPYFCHLPPSELDCQSSDDLEWFEEKQQQVEMLDQQLRKLHTSVESLVQHRKELAVNTAGFAGSAALLATAEEHTALSRALSQLASVSERIDQLHADQADADFFVLSELLNDYIGMVSAVKAVFHERVKAFKTWKDTELNLERKREARSKLEQAARKLDKIPAISQEITQLEVSVEQQEKKFEQISKTIRQEMMRFERQRVRDFKSTIVNYLQALMNSQQKLIEYWEAYLPEAKAIA